MSDAHINVDPTTNTKMDKKDKFSVSPHVIRADLNASQASINTANEMSDSQRPRLDSCGSKAGSETSQKSKPKSRLDSLRNLSRQSSFKQSNFTVNSSTTNVSGFPTNGMSRSSLRINFVTEANALMPSFTSLFSLEDAHLDVLQSVSQHNLDMSQYPQAASSYRDKLDMLDNPAYTDTVRSNDSAASLLRRSFSVPMQYTFQSQAGQKAKEVSKDPMSQHGNHADTQRSQQSLQEALERPDYTDSLQSTGSGTALLARKAIGMHQESQHRLAASLGGIREDSVRTVIDPDVCTKNLYVMSISFLLVFAAYTGLRNLQSSLVSDGTLASYALCSIYASVFIGCIFATTVVQHLRPKVTMSLGMMSVLLFVGANLYPQFYTLVPACSIVGFFLANMWTAQATYIINMAAAYGEATGKTLQSVLSRFNGIFFAFFGIAQLLGGIITSLILILSKQVEPLTTLNETSSNIFELDYHYYNIDHHSNASENLPLLGLTEANSLLSELDEPDNVTWVPCGYNFCLSSHVSAPGPQLAQHTLYILLSIYALLILSGLGILVVFLDRLEGQMKKSHASLLQQLTAVFRWFFDVRVLLLLALMFYTLIQMSFMFGEFTKAFVTCPLGMELVGFGMMCMSFCSSIAAYLSSHIVKAVGRPPIFIGAGLLHLLLMIVMLQWTPDRQTMPVLFVMLGLWGMADGLLFTQVVSFIGLLFSDKKEAAFAGLKMCQALGACTNFLTAKMMCTTSKIYLIMTVLLVAMAGYAVLEIRLRVHAKNDKREKKVTIPTKV